MNNPHNPTGRVFDIDELSVIASLCQEHDAIAITDEVYEEMVYGRSHVRLAALPGMWERTLTLSSLGKTFSLTGWKVGWGIGPPALTAGFRAAHQFMTFTTPTPVQHGAIAALGAPDSFFDDLRSSYVRKRDLLASGLADRGFEVFLPQGTYFMMAGHSWVRIPRRPLVLSSSGRDGPGGGDTAQCLLPPSRGRICPGEIRFLQGRGDPRGSSRRESKLLTSANAVSSPQARSL